MRTPSGIESTHLEPLCARLLSMKELSGDLPPTFTTETARLLGIHPLDLYARRDAGEIIGLSKGPSVGATHPLPPTLTPSQRTTAQRQRSCVGCRPRDPRPHRRDAHRHADRSPDQNPHPRHRLPDGDRVPLRPVDVRPWTRVLRGGSRGAGTDLRPGAYGRRADAVPARPRGAIAHGALDRYLSSPGARPALLLEYAAALGIFDPMRSALDVASAR